MQRYNARNSVIKPRMQFCSDWKLFISHSSTSTFSLSITLYNQQIPPYQVSFLNTASDSSETTSFGSLFHTRTTRGIKKLYRQLLLVTIYFSSQFFRITRPVACPLSKIAQSLKYIWSFKILKQVFRSIFGQLSLREISPNTSKCSRYVKLFRFNRRFV